MTNINIGTGPNTDTGDLLRDAFIICNNNFAELSSSIAAITPEVLTIEISQVNGLQTELNALSSSIQVVSGSTAAIPGIQQDITNINTSISTINNTISNLNIPDNVTNNTFIPFTSTTLDSTYPSASIFARVYCPDLIGGGRVYTRIASGSWVESNITTV